MTSDSRGNTDRQAIERLLCRASSRIAVAAHGIDRQLDKQLAELRQLLRRDIDDPRPLARLIDEIDARIKVVDDERDQRSDILQTALQRLTSQLLDCKPNVDIARELKAMQKQLKRIDADGDEMKLLSRLPVLQGRVLAGDPAARARTGLLTRIFGRNGVELTAVVQAPVEYAAHVFDEDTDADVIDEVESTQITAPTEINQPSRDLVNDNASSQTDVVENDQAALEESIDPASQQEPPFTRISSAVCQVLDHLLKQIDPPPSASDDHRRACEQIAKGLNWYELVSVLEQVSMIVLAALQRSEVEFQNFLHGINERLSDAHRAIDFSRESQLQRQHADANLNDVVRGEVAEMQARVEQASHLAQLKADIGSRLDGIVGALDEHKVSEQIRQRDLESQLDTLNKRLREMESQSAQIEQRMLEQQRIALLDSLTQLPNRNAYEQRLTYEYERWQRYQRPLVLAVCDLDHFKSINDNFGHLAGDKVLRIIAKTLRDRLRKTDFVARFGGEEFVILLPETERQEALQTLDTIRQAVAASPFHFRDKPVAITLSVGIAIFSDTATSDDVFERADTALYQAKQAGRNCCVVAD
jgi:diguanylate cyclase